ncbi:MAG: hypothetical protein LBR11_02940 [Deltaproteobacteria bacterium]|jgi:hypothetical protein|nr:hypothetical protein [Deltaproteobacteria bacterium]
MTEDKSPTNLNSASNLAGQADAADQQSEQSNLIYNSANLSRANYILHQFYEILQFETSKLDQNFNIDKIESLLGNVKLQLNVVVNDILHDSLSQIDEKSLISKKKLS